MENYQNPYVDPYPGATASAIDMRRRYALGVLQQSGDGTPTKANAIGAIARALQGAMGGYLAGQADQSDLADKAKTQALVQQLLPGGAPAASPAAPQASAAPVSPNDASAPDQYKPLIQTASSQYGIPPEVLTRQLQAESNFNPRAVSPVGAQGIAQFMPGTAKDMGVNPLDPNSAIPGAAQYLAQNRDRYGGDMVKALAAYNWGPGNVDKWNGDPNRLPPETRNYVAKILGPQAFAAQQPGPQLAGPAPTPDTAPPQQVAQNMPQGAPQGVPPAGDPNRAAIIAQLLATRSGGQIGSSLAGALINQQIAAPEFKQIGQDVLGRPSYGWVSPQKQTVTPVGGAGNAASGGATPGADASFTQIQSAVGKGAAPADVYQYVPVELREAVKSIVEGRGVPTNLGTRGNARNAAMMYAHAVDPSFDEALIPQRMTFARSMGSMLPSAVGGQKVLLGTSLGHLADLSDSAVDMGNSNGMGLAPLAHGYNAVMNQGTDQSAKALALEDKAQKFAGEVGKLYSGSAGGGVHEREETRSRIGATKSPAELAAGLEANRDLILSKLQALEEQRDAAFGRNGPKVIEFQTPQVKATLDKIQKNIDKLRGKGGAAADAAPAAQQPSTPITKNIGGKTYINQNGQWYEQ